MRRPLCLRACLALFLASGLSACASGGDNGPPIIDFDGGAGDGGAGDGGAGDGGAGDSSLVDAGRDARASNDAGEDATPLDASPGDASLPTNDAGSDARDDAERDAGLDSGRDASSDGGHDAGFDAGHDAGFDAGHDAGFDAGQDAGPDFLSCPSDDAFEPNDTLGAPRAIVPGVPLNAIVCSGDDDYYAITTGAACTLTVSLDFTHTVGDIDLYLLRADGSVLQSSTGTVDDEHLELAVPSAGTYYIRVRLFAGMGNRYTMLTSASCPPPLSCPADDTHEPNDTVPQATLINVGELEAGIVCGGDVDYYAIEAGAGCTVSADLLFAHADGDLDLRLERVDGEVLASSNSLDDNERIEATVGAAATYYLRIHRASGGDAVYDLTTALSCPPPLACPADDGFEENDSRATATPLVSGDSRRAALCGGDLDYYALRADAGCSIAANLLFRDADADLDLVLEDSMGVVIASSRSVDDNESIRITAPRTGTYYLQASRFGSGDALYDVDLTVSCLSPMVCPADDAYEPNDTYESASPLDAGGTRNGIVCGAERDVFGIDVPAAGCSIITTLSFSHAAGNLDLGVANSTGAIVAASTSVDDDESVTYVAPSAGRYYVGTEITGATAAASNTYTLRATVQCEPILNCALDDTHEENDSIGAAAPLADGDSIEGVVCGADADYYSVVAAAGCTIDADLVFSHAEADLDLAILNASAVVLASGLSSDDDEAASALVGLPGTYYVAVYRFAGTSARYRLAVDITCAETLECPSDDGFEPNDTRAEASALRPSEAQRGIVCGADLDYFAVEASAGCTVGANLLFAHAAGDLDLRAETSTGALLASSLSTTDNEALGFVAPSTGTYYLRVNRFSGGNNTYSIDATVTCPPPLTCPADDVFEPNDAIATSYPIFSTPDSVRGIVCGGDLDFYDVVATNGCDVVVDLLFDDATADLDLRLQDSSGTTLASSLSTSDNERIVYRVTSLGLYYVRVNSYDGGNNDYDLNIDVLCP